MLHASGEMRGKGWKVIMVLNIQPSTHTSPPTHIHHTFMGTNCILGSSKRQWVSNIIVVATPASEGSKRKTDYNSCIPISPISLGPTGMPIQSLLPLAQTTATYLNHLHHLADLPSPIPPQAAHPPTSSPPSPPSAKPPPPATPPPSPPQHPYTSPSPPLQLDTKHNTSPSLSSPP